MRAESYLLRAVLWRFALALPLLALVYLGFVVGEQGRALAQQRGWAVALAASALHLPLIAVQVAPPALLFTTVLALGALRRSGEVETLFALGLAPSRARRPLLLAGLGGLLLVVGLNEVVVPACERAADALHPGPVSSPLTGLTAPPAWFHRDGWFLHLHDGQLLGLRWDGSGRPSQRVDGVLSGGGVAEATLSRLERARTIRRQVGHLPLAAAAAVGRLQREAAVRAEAMNSWALYRYLRAARAAGQRRTAEQLVLHTKLVHPLQCLVVVIFACGGLRSTRSGATLASLARAGGFAILLWGLLAVGWLLARGGVVSAPVAVWGALLLGAGVAWTRQHRVLRGIG